MNVRQVMGKLRAGGIVGITRAEWERLAPRFQVLEVHETRLAGQLLLVRGPAGLAAVEQPEHDRRVIRPLADETAARSFIRDRLETYDRMWDGCGCRIDYLR
jgi:hypothetical protein